MDIETKIKSKLPVGERLFLISLTTTMGAVFVIVGLYAITAAMGGSSSQAFGGMIGAIFTGFVLAMGGLAIITTCIIRLERKPIVEEAAERVLNWDEYRRFVKINRIGMNIRIALGAIVILANLINCIVSRSIWVIDASSLILAGVLITWVGETQRLLQMLDRVYQFKVRRNRY